MMPKQYNILFVSSGNSDAGITHVVKIQGESLKRHGHNVIFYTIKGKGIKGYLGAIRPLRKFMSGKNINVIHAHYSLSGFVCSLTMLNKPIVVSLMGSDVMEKSLMKPLIKLFSFFSWKHVIVKSKEMKNNIGLSKAHIIPNGVDFDYFRPIDKKESRKIINWDTDKKHLLFLANPRRPEKNYNLTEKAFKNLNINGVELHILDSVPHEQVPYWINASDVAVLSSLWEGSPNVIKEAMACNCPIVSTDVGDVKKIIGNTEGCYLTSFEVEDVAKKLKLALDFGKKTNGRDHIKYLNEKIIAEKIIAIYKKSLINKLS